jgi:formylglycine-generating enzyme required for sulfatase activity
MGSVLANTLFRFWLTTSKSSDRTLTPNKKLHTTSIATKFLALTPDQREVLIDEIADDVENMIDRLRRKALRAPEIPPQGYGPHFEIDADGRVTFAPPEVLDRQGNNVARLKEYHPILRALASELVCTLGTGNSPHYHLGTRVEAYRSLVDQDLERVNFARLYVEGVRLANADKQAVAAIGDNELPPLSPTIRADMDTLIQVHGTFMMATTEGIESVEAWHRYRRTALEEAEFRIATDGFVNSMENQPQVIDPKVAKFARDVVNEIGTSRNAGGGPERGSAVAAGVVTNVMITIVSAATIGVLAAAAGASQSPPLIASAAAALLVLGEGLKKSKPFAVVAALVTKGFDNISETEIANAYREISKQLAPVVGFAAKAAPLLRRLAAQRESGLNWVPKSLDWLTQPVKGLFPQQSRHFGSGRLIIPRMVRVPPNNLPDTFRMGSTPGEGRDQERPQREITIRNAFEVGFSAVTRAEFAAFVDATSYKVEKGAHVWTGKKWDFDESKSWHDPGFAQEDDHPVVCVSWRNAKSYLKWLNRLPGAKPYRLLSEAEWEYCCRAGTTSAYSTGDSITPEQANLAGRLRGTTSVFAFPPNAWGLHDMHGNVWEWCDDNWHKTYDGDPPTDGLVWPGGESSSRVLRGGSWYNNPENLRSTSRLKMQPAIRSPTIGFRVARTL